MLPARFRSRELFYALCSTLLFIAFAFSVMESLAKFYLKRTSNSVETHFDDAPLLPVISFCPGFRHLPASNSSDSDMFPTVFSGNTKEKVTEEELMEWWQSVTFSLQDIFTSIKAPQNPKILQGADIKFGLNPETNISISRVSTTSGNCYSVRLHSSVVARYSLEFQLNLTKVQDISVYIHNPGDEMGMYNNYWAGFAHYENIISNMELDMSLIKEVHKVRRSSKFVCEDGEDYSYGTCWSNWARKAYVENSNCSEVCWIPQAGYIMGTNSKMGPCLTPNATQCMHRHLISNVISELNTHSLTGCLNPCAETHYQVKRRGLPQKSSAATTAGSFANIYIFLESEGFDVYEEYLLFDLNAIVAAVGGALGLFLGFSFRDATNGLVDLLAACKWWNNRISKPTGENILPPSS